LYATATRVTKYFACMQVNHSMCRLKFSNILILLTQIGMTNICKTNMWILKATNKATEYPHSVQYEQQSRGNIKV